jgi:hypothetical protein
VLGGLALEQHGKGARVVMTFAPLLLAYKKPQPSPLLGGIENNARHKKTAPTLPKVGAGSKLTLA